MNARDLVNSVFEMAMDTGGHPDFIDPKRKRQFTRGEHPMAKNAAYPEFQRQPGQKEVNWEEVVGGGQYRDTMQRIQTFFNRLHGREEGTTGGYTPQTIHQALAQGVQDAMAMERPYRRALEKLAIDLLLEQPEFQALKKPYEAGEFKIDAKLGVTGETGGVILSTDPGVTTPQQEFAAFQELAGFDEEVAKRKVLNALIAGGAVSKNYAYQLINQKIEKISPGLPTLYGMMMAATELGYFATPDEHVAMAARQPGMAGGSMELDMGEEGGGDVPTIKVRAMVFPMLVQELAKGFLELAAYEGLPKQPGLAKAVINKADLADEEAWAMIMGRGLWMRFVNAIGADDDSVTLHLYNRIASLPAPEFNQTMKVIQASGPEAEKLLREMAAAIRSDIEAEERSSHGEYRDQGGEQGGEEGGEFGDPDGWKNG